MQRLCVCGCVCVRWGFRARDSLIGLIRRSLCTAPERIVLFLPSFFFAPPVFCFDVPQTDVIALAAAVTSSLCRLKREPPALLLSYPSPPSLLLLFPLEDECVSADLPPPPLRPPCVAPLRGFLRPSHFLAQTLAASIVFVFSLPAPSPAWASPPYIPAARPRSLPVHLVWPSEAS